MPFVLLLICVVALGVSAAFGEKGTPAKSISAFPIALILVLALAAKTQLPPTDQLPSEIGLVLGAVLVFLAGFLEGRASGATTSLALGCAAAGCLGFFQEGKDTLALAATVGAGATAAILNLRTASLTALAISAVGFCQILTTTKNGPPALATTASIAIATATAIAMIGQFLGKAKTKPWHWPALACFLTAVATWGVAKVCLGGATDWTGLLTVPIGVAVILGLEGNRDDRPVFHLALTTVIWIGIATVAFGSDRGAGIGLAFLLATGLLIATNQDRVLLSSGPLLGLTLSRVFRVEHSAIGGAIDIAQHYSLIGFGIGALLPLLPFEWLANQTRMGGWARSMVSVLWLLVVLVAPCLIALFLAPKGLFGFVTGLGFCGMFAMPNSKFNVSVLSLAAGLGAIAVLEFGKLETLTDLSREEKIHWFLISGVGLAIMAALIGGIGALNSKKEQMEPA